jgi:hypothetical protein
MLVSTSPALAHADSLRNDSSLRWIPETASFYVSCQRGEEQWNRISQSRAYRRLMQMPLVQMGIAQLKAKWNEDSDDEFGKIRSILNAPENKPLMDLVCDAVSHEIFLCGDQGFEQVMKMLVRLSEESNRIQFEALAEGGDIDGDELGQRMFALVMQDLGKLDVPPMIIGFRLSDTAIAKSQLARLAALIEKAAADIPELAKAYKKQTISGTDFITLTGESSMIPWDKIAADADTDEREKVEQVAKALEGKQATAALGLHDEFLILHIGATLDDLEAWGTRPLLWDKEEMTIVRQADEKPVTSVSYVSGEFLRAISRPKEQLDSYVKLAQAALPRAELEKELQDTLLADVERLANDVKRWIPDQGTAVSVQFMTDDGFEGYRQNWTENLLLDGSKPLDILSHTGGSPLVMIAARSRLKNGEGYKFLATWLQRLGNYGQVIAEKNLEGAQRETFESVQQELVPLIKRSDEITRDELIPALQDGQGAWVLDAKMESRQWHFLMPPASEPLPMFEVAEVYGVSDAAKLKNAFANYGAVADDLLKFGKKMVEEYQEELNDMLDGPAQALPALLLSMQVPTPKIRETDDGQLYEFNNFSRIGLDARLAPAVGISADTLVMSLSPQTVERLLATTPLEAAAPLADYATRNLAVAAHVDVAGLIGVIRAWTNYGLTTAAELQDNEQIAAVAPMVDTVMEILQCFRTYENASYVQDDSMVTHARSRFRDLAE